MSENNYKNIITEELLNYEMENAEYIAELIIRDIGEKDLDNLFCTGSDVHMEDMLSQSGKVLYVKINDIREQMKKTFELVEFSGLLNSYEKTLNEINVIAQAYNRCNCLEQVQSKAR